MSVDQEVWTSVKCDSCGDEAVTLPDTTCGRDLSEELGPDDGTTICQGVYRSAWMQVW